MLMPRFITRIRRDWWIARVQVVGPRLRELEAARAGIDHHIWPDVADEIDASIDHLNGKLDRLLTKIKETA